MLFHHAYATLGAANWTRFDGAAQYACSGAGHQRAKHYASGMLGELDRKELIDRIVNKRHQDSVRALGLCPLDLGKQRETDILARYKTYQEFLRTSKQFGSQRRASEQLAVEVGMENLARTAGFTDPQRLQSAMEAVEIADLVIKPQLFLINDTTVEMRSSILRETCRLMKLNNVQIQGSHALIKGEIGTYSVHLARSFIVNQVVRSAFSPSVPSIADDYFYPSPMTIQRQQKSCRRCYY